MDDQRGLTPADFELPEFLKVSQENGNRAAELVNGGDYGTKAKLRRTDLHNSDSSIYDTINDETRLSRSFSRSQDKLPVTWQQSEDSQSMRSFKSFGSPQKIPFMDQSFSQEGLVPSHFDAEEYFSHSLVQSNLPDYDDSRLMDKSLRDIGLGLGHGLDSSKLSQRSAEISHDARATTPISLLPSRLSPRVKTPEVPPRLPPKPHPRVPKRQHPPSSDEKSRVSLASEEELDATLLPSPEVHAPSNPRPVVDCNDKRAYLSRPYGAPLSHFSSNQHLLQQQPTEQPDESDIECDIRLGLNGDSGRAESTPSPTTHDLVLESSPDTGDSPRIVVPPKPAVRTSLLSLHSSSNIHQHKTHLSIV